MKYFYNEMHKTIIKYANTLSIISTCNTFVEAKNKNYVCLLYN